MIVLSFVMLHFSLFCCSSYPVFFSVYSCFTILIPFYIFFFVVTVLTLLTRTPLLMSRLVPVLPYKTIIYQQEVRTLMWTSTVVYVEVKCAVTNKNNI
jgi:predicted CDP-diglyceride synthetase/phosphatidate cytidylyltransferase